MSRPPYLLTNEELLEVYNLTYTATAIHVTEDAIIQEANDAMLRIWGKDRSVIGKSLQDALPELKGQPFIEMFKRVWNEGLIIAGEDTPADLEIDGQIKTFYFDFEYRAVKNNDGKVICILHTALDVTERVLKTKAIQRAAEKEAALNREQALNEELAATNEELSATNDELQHTQERLSALNYELEDRVRARVNELSESEKRFQTMAEATDILISVSDEFGNALYFNKPWVALTGRSIQDFLKSGWIDLIHPDDKQNYVDVYFSALEKKAHFSAEFRLLSKGGEYRWILVNGPPRLNADGSFAGYISAGVDITERKIIELEKQSLSALVDASSEFISLANLDQQMVYANPVALKKLGWNSVENRFLIDCVYPPDRDFAKVALSNLAEYGIFRYEIRFWNEKTEKPFWINWNCFSILDELSSEVSAIATIGPDITERKLYQEELQNVNEEMAAANEELAATNEELAATNEELAQTHNDLVQYIKKLSDSEEKLFQAIETGKMGTWSIEPHSLDLSLSNFVKDFLGIATPGKVSVKEVMKAVQPVYHQILYNAYHNAITYRTASDLEFVINNILTGEEKWVRTTGKVFLNQSGYIEEFSGMFMDITERKLDELRKNDFIGMVSHELKTPLTAINGFVQVLQRKARLGEDHYSESALDKTHIQIKKMTTMINGFLNVSRLESGKLLIDRTSFRLDNLLRETVDETFISPSTHKIVLGLACDVTVNADRDKIGNVISNLLSNAHKYSPNGTSIAINCQVVDREVIVSVKDEGIGISMDDAKKLFERYYRVQSNHTISGFGIGLYLSAEIIERHNGKIWVESEGGQGSTFYFSLPIE
ncbi:PAS domain S-box protein [Pedobacter sandarakinus]|uniref:PAS domain S-box protein n=1 Tax=Pedobacter sandarakinus TaxID=353156 RepID=UPI002245C104|nr:PAS domain S-box protein [Pedobacter sandarakinus]MCX2573132.1 PAS domain S-box protein [Pedobacter sandarakinus]